MDVLTPWHGWSDGARHHGDAEDGRRTQQEGRGGRSASTNIIPSSTGAAKAVGKA